jgi:hypothetical protein
LGNIHLTNPFNLGNLRLKVYQSKLTKLCKTKPIFGIPKMSLTDYKIRTYTNNLMFSTMQKQSQSKPILPACMADKIAPSEACGERSRTVEGLVVSLSNPVELAKPNCSAF